MKLQTKLIHAGEPHPRCGGAVVAPVFQSSTFECSDSDGYHDVRYARLSNTPSHHVLHDKIAALEGGEAALVTASGMAAISTTLMTVLRAGDHLLAHRNLYGGTHGFITQELESFGVTHTFVDADAPETWEAARRPNTRLFYVETITNPLAEVVDLKEIVQFARRHGLVSMIDSTFASPVNFRPIEVGFDIVLHSGSKYLNGHSDLIAGAVIGKAERIESIRHHLNHFGGSLDAHACFLLHRGLRTLALRVNAQGANAIQVARFLDQHAAVGCVHYPGLESHPQHARARDLFDGFGGMLSFELRGGVEAAQRLIEHLQIAIHAVSLGGVETLISLPARTSHAGLDAEQRRQLGITDGLIRMSVGIEACEDLIGDLAQALEKAAATSQKSKNRVVAVT